MASAWGDSWGSSWGDSWGELEEALPVWRTHNMEGMRQSVSDRIWGVQPTNIVSRKMFRKLYKERERVKGWAHLKMWQFKKKKKKPETWMAA